MRLLSKRTSSLNSYRRSPHITLSSTGPLIGVAHLLAFIVFLCFSRDAYSRLWRFDNPRAKVFLPPFPIHPASFPLPPTATTTKCVKPIRKSQSRPPSASLVVCLAVVSVFARLAPDEPEVQRKPAVISGRGIEEPSDITTPISNTTADDTKKNSSPDAPEAPRKPAACSGRGIEESSDVTTTPIFENTENDSIYTPEVNAEKPEHDDTTHPHGDNHNDPPIIFNADNNTGMSVTNFITAKNMIGLMLVCAVAASERMNNKHLQALAKHICWHQPQCATKPTTPESKAQDEEATCEAEAEQITEIEESEEAATKRRIAMWEAEARAMTEKSKNVPVAKPQKFSWDDDWSNAEDDDDDSGDWFTISKGKTVKASSRVSSSRSAPSDPTPTATKSDADVGTTITSPTDTDKGLSSGSTSLTVAEASPSEAKNAQVRSPWSKVPEWRTQRRAELPAFPRQPQPPQARQRYKIVPANDPDWLEARAERQKKEMEAWNAFKEAERAAERAKIEEEERKAREVEEAKAARIVKFDTAMSRIGDLLKAAKEEKEKNEKALKEIDVAQGKIGELVDLEKVRDLFDPEVLGSSSLFSTTTQLRIHPSHEISNMSSAVAGTTTLPDSEYPDASSSSSVVAEMATLPDIVEPPSTISDIVEPSSSTSDIIEATALPSSEDVKPSSETSIAVEETTPPNLEISKAEAVSSSSTAPKSYALAVQSDSTTFQSNAAERSVPPQTMTAEEREERRRKAQNKATEERRKRRKKAHARWLAQQAEAANGGGSSGSGEAR